jgi:hypothetical protein
VDHRSIRLLNIYLYGFTPGVAEGVSAC